MDFLWEAKKDISEGKTFKQRVEGSTELMKCRGNMKSEHCDLAEDQGGQREIEQERGLIRRGNVEVTTGCVGEEHRCDLGGAGRFTGSDLDRCQR